MRDDADDAEEITSAGAVTKAEEEEDDFEDFLGDAPAKTGEEEAKEIEEEDDLDNYL